MNGDLMVVVMCVNIFLNPLKTIVVVVVVDIVLLCHSLDLWESRSTS